MVFRLIKKDELKKASGCHYQEYSKESNGMIFCGKRSVCKTAKGNLCAEHAEYVLANDPSYEAFDRNDKLVTAKQFIQAMLDLA